MLVEFADPAFSYDNRASDCAVACVEALEPTFLEGTAALSALTGE
jgi:hypothetical protein